MHTAYKLLALTALAAALRHASPAIAAEPASKPPAAAYAVNPSLQFCGGNYPNGFNCSGVSYLAVVMTRSDAALELRGYSCYLVGQRPISGNLAAMDLYFCPGYSVLAQYMNQPDGATVQVFAYLDDYVHTVLLY